MKLHKLTIILTISGILLLTYLAQSKPINEGTILKITKTNYKTTIQLEESNTELIIFEKISLELKEGGQIKFQGKPDIYKNQSQIIISKLSKIDS